MKRFSRKREAILEAIRSTTLHPSAEWVYMKLKPEYPDLSLATVYRNIAEFMEDGKIISVGSVGGQERYDGCTNPHTHFVCDFCGCVIDVPEVDPMIDYNAVEGAVGAIVSNYNLTFHGKCKNCSLNSKDT